MKKDNLTWLFMSFIVVILASITFSILSMVKASDPINTVFMIIHCVDLLVVCIAWIIEERTKKS